MHALSFRSVFSTGTAGMVRPKSLVATIVICTISTQLQRRIIVATVLLACGVLAFSLASPPPSPRLSPAAPFVTIGGVQLWLSRPEFPQVGQHQ